MDSAQFFIHLPYRACAATAHRHTVYTIWSLKYIQHIVKWNHFCLLFLINVYIYCWYMDISVSFPVFLCKLKINSIILSLTLWYLCLRDYKKDLIQKQIFVWRNYYPKASHNNSHGKHKKHIHFPSLCVISLSVQGKQHQPL